MKTLPCKPLDLNTKIPLRLRASYKSPFERPRHSPDTIVGGRISLFIKEWEKITTNKVVLSIVRSGLQLRRTDEPMRPHLFRQRPLSEAELLKVETSQKECLEKGAYVAIPRTDAGDPRLVCERLQIPYTGQKSVVVSPHFVVAKKNSDKWRLVHDLRGVNSSTPNVKFKLENFKDVMLIVEKNYFMTSLDITDAYYSVKIDPHDIPAMGMAGVKSLKDQVLLAKTMPFGLNVAPRIFTKIMREIMTHLRKKGIRCVIYIDDILIVAKTKELCHQHTKLAAQVLQSLGFLLNWKKSHLDPTQELLFLGLMIDSIRMSIYIPKSKLAQVRSDLSYIKKRPTVQLRTLAKLLGRISAISLACTPAYLKTRRLMDCQVAAIHKGLGYNENVAITPEAQAEIEWWETHLEMINGKPFNLTPTLQIEADASGTGYGMLLRDIASGRILQQQSGFWNTWEASSHVNEKELLAQLFAIQVWIPLLKKCPAVLLLSDNMTTVSHIRKQGGTVSPRLSSIAEEIWNLAIANDVNIQIRWIPGKDNVDADRLSRLGHDRNDWKLNPREFRKLSKEWGPFTIDLFATRVNKQVERFYSWGPEPGSSAIDALAQPWKNENAWANPPWSLIPKIIRKIRNEKACSLTMITPDWPSASWYPVLRDLTSDFVLLTACDDLFLPGLLGSEQPVGKPKWNVVAWHICAEPCSAKESQ